MDFTFFSASMGQLSKDANKTYSSHITLSVHSIDSQQARGTMLFPSVPKVFWAGNFFFKKGGAPSYAETFSR
jgi:hypothetical protein